MGIFNRNRYKLKHLESEILEHFTEILERNHAILERKTEILERKHANSPKD